MSSRAGRRRFTVAETLQYVSDIEDESDIDEFDDDIDDANFVQKIENLQGKAFEVGSLLKCTIKTEVYCK